MQSSASRSVARKYNITAIDEQNAHCDHHSGQGIIKSHNLFTFDKGPDHSGARLDSFGAFLGSRCHREL